MGDEMNKELELETAEQRETVEPVPEKVETMEDYKEELEASYQMLNQRSVQMAESDDGAMAVWAELEQMREARQVVKVKITEVVKGGVIAYLNEIRGFIPASQISTEYVEKLEDWQGKYLEVMVITVDPEKKRLVMSGREVAKEKQEADKKARIAECKAGDVAEGTVETLKPYGAFVKLSNGATGLLHISQISTQRIKHPGVVLKEGQSVKVKILSVTEEKISLSMKALQTEETQDEEVFDYKENGTVSTGLGDLLKGLKL